MKTARDRQASPNGQYRIRSIDRALTILDAFDSLRPRMSLTDLCQATQLPPSTAYRIAANLVHRGYLSQDSGRGDYWPGLALIRLAGVALGQLDVREKAAPALKQLRDDSKETVHLAALDGRRVIYLEKLEGLHAVGLMSSRVGRTAPAHCTALGKALLAFGDGAAEEDVLSRKLERFTPRTIVDGALLRGHLAKVREQGYAIDVGEHETDVCCVAAPVRDHSGKTIAAISVAGPAQRMEVQMGRGLIKDVVAAANRICRDLGYLGDAPRSQEDGSERTTVGRRDSRNERSGRSR
jgi:IclR family acetate operon transcriptional repressor